MVLDLALFSAAITFLQDRFQALSSHNYTRETYNNQQLAMVIAVRGPLFRSRATHQKSLSPRKAPLPILPFHEKAAICALADSDFVAAFAFIYCHLDTIQAKTCMVCRKELLHKSLTHLRPLFLGAAIVENGKRCYFDNEIQLKKRIKSITNGFCWHRRRRDSRPELCYATGP